MKTIFITGANGLLGSFLTREILMSDSDTRVIALIRAENSEKARTKLLNSLRIITLENIENFINRIEVYSGDITEKNLGLSEDVTKRMISSVEEIYHCAALTDFVAPLSSIRIANVEGTRNVLDFATHCQRKKNFECVNHISTAYLVGRVEEKKFFFENELDVAQTFNNSYEQTKYEAEHLVRSYVKSGLPATIFRTCVIGGDSISGATVNFKSIYQLVRILLSEAFDFLPVDSNAILNILPADQVAQAIRFISRNKGEDNKTFHIVNQAEVSLGDLVSVICELFGLKEPILYPYSDRAFRSLSFAQKRLLAPFLGYLNHTISFDATNALKVLSKSGIQFRAIDRDYLSVCLGYAARFGFLSSNITSASRVV